jgi:fructose-1,6-bisphosphatase/inositol monophosphatase family enzyme
VRDPLIDQVGEVLRRAARTAVLPLFRHLADGDVQEKAPGEVVTVADRKAELIISAGLRDVLPGSTVVGEEGVAADPEVLRLLTRDGPVWLVDPVDGTANFAAGHGPFMMMVALLHDRVTEASWLLDPQTDRLAWARRGAGAYLDADRVTTAAAADGPPRPELLRGSVVSRFLPHPLRASVERRARRLGAVLPSVRCAGFEYPNIVEGSQDFAFFWRTLPWDHVPGTLFTEEAGGVVRRLDGSRYDPTDDRSGLLAAASQEIWDEVHGVLFVPDDVSGT